MQVSSFLARAIRPGRVGVYVVCALGLALDGGCMGTIDGGPQPPTDSRRRPDGSSDGEGSDPDQGGTKGRDTSMVCTDPSRVGITPLRRLTRAQYARAVRDVFHVEADVGELAPDERVGRVFSSNAEASVTSIQLRQYMDVAEQVSERIDAAALAPCSAKQTDEQCARAWVETMGRRAYRRPLVANEAEDLVRAYQALRAAGDDRQGALRVLAQALLQSPSFLYHLELEGAEKAAPGGLIPLPAFALASRLSFMLWGSVPDDALLTAAAEGRLDEPREVAAEVERMLDDPRAQEAIAQFHAEWLGLERLDQAVRDPVLFPEWTPDLRQSMKDEAGRFADHVIREQRGSLADLLTSSVSFPDDKTLALRLGGEARPDGSAYLMDPKRRAGLLTQPAFLAAHSHSNQTSPILRGRAVRERLFCQPLADPPPEVAAQPPELDSTQTTRQRYAEHRTAGSACNSCHRLIDDLGFALEHYDPLGRYRERDNGQPVDSTFSLLETDIDGDMNGAIELSGRAADSDEVRTCYARQWFRFALGRAEQSADACALERMTRTFDSDTPVRDLLEAIATSDSFMKRPSAR